MRIERVLTAAAIVLWTVALGLLGNSERATAATYAPSLSDVVYSTDAYYSDWSLCTPGSLGYNEPVFIADDGTVYGDQDGNGIIDGMDCDWR